jgi:biofilm PGA synthesis N-glycosyltransferase PgaC
MSFFALTLFIALGLYSLLLLWSTWQCLSENKGSEFATDAEQHELLCECPSSNKFSILIPFRNEEKNLGPLLKAINQIDYPQTHAEIIFIDDHSQDQGVEFLNSCRSQGKFKSILLRLSQTGGFGKKQAINQGVASAQNPWIITLDADTLVTPHWLKSIDRALRRKNIKFLAGPVVTSFSETLLGHMQSAEFNALQGLTKAFFKKKPILCNGANLVYEKELFYTVSGFEGNQHLSSGDDVFLMEKIKTYNPNLLGYNSDFSGAVLTRIAGDWKSYKDQQIRWFSKTTALNNPLLTAISALVFTVNFFIVLGFFTMVYLGATRPSQWFELWDFFAVYILVKFVIDHLFLMVSSPKDVFKGLWTLKRVSWPRQVMASLFYPFWIFYIVLSTQFYSPLWKGREIINDGEKL